MANDSAPPSSWAASFRRQVLPLLLWVAVALLVRWALLEPRWIPSESMLPTLQVDDRVLVEKIRARLHRPLPTGTVVVFHAPAVLQQAGYDPKAALIKRVVGQAGDTIAVVDGMLWRNGQPVAHDWAADAMTYRMDAITVPPEHLWVMGDNRNASLDSHLWGPLPSDAVIGTAILRYWPLNRFGWLRFSPPSTGPSHQLQLG